MSLFFSARIVDIGFYVGVGDPNLSHHIYIARTIASEQSPQRLCFCSFKNIVRNSLFFSLLQVYGFKNISIEVTRECG